MKTRSGFVSNSSSSSFVAIVEKSVFEKALENLKDERDRKVIKHVAQKQNKFGKTLMTVNEYSDSGGFSNLFGEGDDFDFEAAGITEEEVNEPYDDGSGYEDEAYTPSAAIYVFHDVLEKMMKKNKAFKDDILIVQDAVG
jgi:hypothetical protein